jgi:hypothetical protein
MGDDVTICALRALPNRALRASRIPLLAGRALHPRSYLRLQMAMLSSSCPSAPEYRHLHRSLAGLSTKPRGVERRDLSSTVLALPASASTEPLQISNLRSSALLLRPRSGAMSPFEYAFLPARLTATVARLTRYVRRRKHGTKRFSDRNKNACLHVYAFVSAAHATHLRRQAS